MTNITQKIDMLTFLADCSSWYNLSARTAKKMTIAARGRYFRLGDVS